jgi:hypothetical protein
VEKLRKILTFAIVLWLIGVFAYGIYHFRDAPIRAHSGGTFAGKQGQAHTYEEFQAFKTWETTLIYSWPIGIVALYLIWRKW